MLVTKGHLSVDASHPHLAQEILARLDEFGVAFVPAFTRDVPALRADFERAMDDARARQRLAGLDPSGKNIAPSYGETATGTHLKLETYSSYADTYPAMAELFGCSLMREVARSYLGDLHTLNRHMILTHDQRPADAITPFHFDEMRSLKFLVYLTPTTAQTGPFEAIPRSQAGGKTVRTLEWHRVGKYSEIRNRIVEDYPEEFVHTVFGLFKELFRMSGVAMDGPAGSMAIFDTDCIHRGGRFTGGEERLVIRGSSYTGIWPG